MKEEVSIHGKNFALSITADALAERVTQLAEEVEQSLDGADPLCLIALKGGFVFASDLLRALSIDPEIEFIGLSSYTGMRSSGNVDIVHALDAKRVEGRTVLIIEDIVDTGRTMKVMNDYLIEIGANNVISVVLLLKPDALNEAVEINHIGFSIPDEFVVGYGLDYEQRGRSLAGIYQLKGE